MCRVAEPSYSHRHAQCSQSCTGIHSKRCNMMQQTPASHGYVAPAVPQESCTGCQLLLFKHALPFTRLRSVSGLSCGGNRRNRTMARNLPVSPGWWRPWRGAGRDAPSSGRGGCYRKGGFLTSHLLDSYQISAGSWLQSRYAKAGASIHRKIGETRASTTIDYYFSYCYNDDDGDQPQPQHQLQNTYHSNCTILEPATRANRNQHLEHMRECTCILTTTLPPSSSSQPARSQYSLRGWSVGWWL